MEYLPRKRNLEDLWWSAFPVGTEWENIDMIKEFNWNFKNLEETLEEGGDLYGKTVYLYGSTETHQLDVNGVLKIVVVPVVVAVDCPFPPSDKIARSFVLTGKEELVPMKKMKMSWVPYVPLQDRFGRIESLKTKIFTLYCTQRRSALKRMETERSNKFYFHTPYIINPPEDERATLVRVVYPLDPPIVCDFDLEWDDYKVLAGKLVKDLGLPEDEKKKIQKFLRKEVEQRKKELDQAEEAQKIFFKEMDPKQREAFENMKLYKFYPVKTPDTPDVSNVKSRHINIHYGGTKYVK